MFERTKKTGAIIILAPWLFATSAFAQSTVANGSNSYEVVCEIVRNNLRDAGLDGAAACTDSDMVSLSYSKNMENNKAATQAILKNLIRELGPQQQMRGTNYVWRVDNPQKSAQQSETITIILTVDSDGTSKISMDRTRPGTVFARGKKQVQPTNKARRLDRHDKKRINQAQVSKQQF